MSYTNPKIMNALGGIRVFLDGDPNKAVYIEPGTELHDAATNGDFGAVEPYVAPEMVITSDMVNAERDRRLLLDFSFNGKMFQRDEVSQRRINGAYSIALGAVMSGAQPGDLRWADPDNDFAWIASDNTVMTMDAQTVLAFGATCASVEAPLVFAAKALKAMDSIPEDYTDDAYWP